MGELGRLLVPVEQGEEALSVADRLGDPLLLVGLGRPDQGVGLAPGPWGSGC